MAIDEARLLQIRGKLKAESKQRGLYTLCGFAALVAGLWIGWGIAVALVAGGGIVFATGLYGMLRT